MGQTDLFTKLIVEHGSAEVQNSLMALVKDQLVVSDKKISELETENSILKGNFENARATIQELTKENEELRSKLQKYEQPTEQAAQKNLHDEAKKNILRYLSSHERSLIPQIAEALNIRVEATKFYVQELKTQKFVKDGFTRDIYGSVFMNFSLDQEGRRFLIEQGLLT